MNKNILNIILFSLIFLLCGCIKNADNEPADVDNSLLIKSHSLERQTEDCEYEEWDICVSELIN
jgi:hypothetical protein